MTIILFCKIFAAVTLLVLGLAFIHSGSKEIVRPKNHPKDPWCPLPYGRRDTDMI